jgi:predicted ABC-type ATPase
MPNLYIIAGCNGAGKTTASFTVLPEMLNCREFVNADSIAAGLSPFDPENVAIEAGRIMLNRVEVLLKNGEDFAIETTLATKSFVSLIQKARKAGYKISLIYFWLSSYQQAIQRVASRVSKGGHHIPDDVIERRYYRGIYNMLNLYMTICDYWAIVNNMETKSQIVISGEFDQSINVYNNDIWNIIKSQADESKS